MRKRCDTLDGSREYCRDSRRPALVGGKVKGMDGIAALQALDNREINFQPSTFWDGGFTARLGDEMNGFAAQGTFPTP